MIEKVVTVRKLGDHKVMAKEDLAYWLSQPLEKRIAAVEELRRQFHGDTARLQRSARVVHRSRR